MSATNYRLSRLTTFFGTTTYGSFADRTLRTMQAPQNTWPVRDCTPKKKRAQKAHGKEAGK